MKSPIKENNNFKCLSELKRMFPKGSVINSFLFYAGNLEFNLAESDRFVIAHTHKYVIYEFWHCALHDPKRIAEMSKHLFPIENPDMFHILQENWPKYPDPYARSALFFLLNRCSDSGWISAGKLDHKNFNPVALSYLSRFNPKNFYITCDESEDLLENIKSTKKADYLLFPVGDFNYNLFEYGKNKGYEMSTVHHKNLCRELKENDNKWVVVYKYHPQPFKLYKEYNISMINKFGNVTTDTQQCEEVLIANF
tara:strand:- start:355 stop:1113 length:759 start_codon:yes stop_codon:yes gene_type:complete